MEKLILVSILLIALLFGNHLLRCKIQGKEKVYYQYSKSNMGSCIFFIVTLLILIITYSVVSILTLMGIPIFGEYMSRSGAGTMIIIAVIGKLYIVLFNIIIKKVNAKYKSKKGEISLELIDDNAKTWIILMVSILLAFVCMIDSNSISEQIGYLAFSIVYGKIIWVNTQLSEIKELLRGFFMLPFMINIIFIILLIALVWILLAKISINHMFGIVIVLAIVAIVFMRCLIKWHDKNENRID